MNLEFQLGIVDAGITRVKYTPAGYLVEVDGTNKAEGYTEHVFQNIFDEVCKHNEIIYRMYVFGNNYSRFPIGGILRTIRTRKSSNMSSSVSGSNDLYCKFTEFDFDYLTLAEPDKPYEALFKLDQVINPIINPGVVYKELDMMGHQFLINAKPKEDNGYYSITLRTQELFE